MQNDIAISVKNLTKVYHLYDNPKDRLKEALNPFGKSYHHDFYALKDVSFEIKKGETVGIIGKNGAGKSTLLKIITGVLTPTSGEVHVNGKIASLLELGAGFNPEMTGLENIYLNGTIMGFTKEEMDAKVDAILEFADIGEFIHQPVKMYSSGMFARLAFSVAINVEPDVLIVDEALSVGDVFFQQKCFAHMRNSLKETTKLFVTHDLATLTQLTDRVVVLRSGEKIFEGNALDAIQVYQEEDHRKRVTDLSEVTVPEHVVVKDSDDINTNELTAIPLNRLTGLQEIKIVAYQLLVGDKESEVVHIGDEVELILQLEAKRASMGECVIGILFRDKHGQMVFGQNTLSEKGFDTFIPGGTSFVHIRFRWPAIKRGEYTITPGIGEVRPENDIEHNIQCWANNIAKLYSVEGHPHECLFSIALDEVKIERMGK